MARNAFAFVPFPFDPPESDEKKFQKDLNAAIASWNAYMERRRKNAVTPEEKNRLEDQSRQFSQAIVILQDRPSRLEAAKAKREEEINKLEHLLRIMLEGQSLPQKVTMTQLQDVKKSSRLSLETVREVYQHMGFQLPETHPRVNLNEIFLSPILFSQCEANLRRLRQLNPPPYPWAPKVQDLYDLACFATGHKAEDRPAFIRRKTSELQQIMTLGAAKFAGDMSIAGHILADLFQFGSTLVFCSDAANLKYKWSILRARDQGFFQEIRSAPDSIKRDPRFAENCIRRLQKTYRSYDVALTLYNLEGRLSDPYEPEPAASAADDR